MSDIDTVGVDGLKVLDPKRPIREATLASSFDHLVSEHSRLCGTGQPECHTRLEVLSCSN